MRRRLYTGFVFFFFFVPLTVRQEETMDEEQGEEVEERILG